MLYNIYLSNFLLYYIILYNIILYRGYITRRLSRAGGTSSLSMRYAPLHGSASTRTDTLSLGRLGDLPGGGVNRRPAPWLLVPGPVAGVERLRADRDNLRLEASMTRIRVQAIHTDRHVTRSVSLATSVDVRILPGSTGRVRPGPARPGPARPGPVSG
jgi:hypothetical protein